MRVYKLIIGEDAAPKLKLELSKAHPIAPRITFNIMRSEADVFVPSMITVFNLPLAYFSASQSLVGEKIRLYAGIEQSPTTAFCKITPTSCKLIFTGYVWNVLPDYDGTMCNITMYCGVANQTNTGKKSKDAKGKEKTDIIEVAVKPKASVGQGFLAFISKLLGSKYTVTATQAARTHDKHQNNETSTIVLNFTDLKTAFTAMTAFGLSALVQDNTVSIFSLEADEDRSSKFKIIPAISDFVAQPTWNTTSRVGVSLLMNAEAAPMKTLSISPKIAIAPSSLVGNMDVVSAVKPSFSATSILGGDFRIISVWHKGDSRGADASSWCTEIEAVSEGNRFTD